MKISEFKERMLSFDWYLKHKEKSANTSKKYMQALDNFTKYFEKYEKGEELSKDCFFNYKVYMKTKYRPKTVNLYITGVNQYLKYIGLHDMCIKSLNIQVHNSLDNCITDEEYKLMLDEAKKLKNDAVYLVIRTLACTGMRIKCLSYITTSVLEKGKVTVTNKGKTDMLIIPQKMCDELKAYCIKEGITEGIIF